MTIDIIIQCVIPYLELEEREKIKINKELKKYIENNMTTWSHDRIKKFVDNYPKNLKDGILETKYRVNIIKFDDNFMGYTSYLDRFTEKNVHSPISIGIDSYNRKFIVFRCKNQLNVITVFSVFQRYSDNDKIWCNGVSGGYSFGIVGRLMGDLTWDYVKRLLLNKNCGTFTYNDDYSDIIEDMDGTKLY